LVAAIAAAKAARKSFVRFTMLFARRASTNDAMMAMNKIQPILHRRQLLASALQFRQPSVPNGDGVFYADDNAFVLEPLAVAALIAERSRKRGLGRAKLVQDQFAPISGTASAQTPSTARHLGAEMRVAGQGHVALLFTCALYWHCRLSGSAVDSHVAPQVS
jgi:hypothetical protein